MDLQFELKQTQRLVVIIDSEAEARLSAVTESLSPDGIVLVHDAAIADQAQRVGQQLDVRALIPVVCDEDTKQLDAVKTLAEQLHAAGATRATVMVAMGGGTLTDLAGFVASIYLRGMPFVSCPTTTLAICDAALGGKNGVDLCGMKNRLGTIRQPDAIVMDTHWLQSLPDELFREGIVEVIKKAAVLDAHRFEQLEALAPALLARDSDATMQTIAMAVEMKMAVVMADERENNKRWSLNAGHTIGHAIEALSGGSLRHGNAVAMGLIAECRAAEVATAITERLAKLLTSIGVQTEIPEHLRNPNELWAIAQRDKKAMRGFVPMYVPIALGEGATVELTCDSLTRAMS